MAWSTRRLYASRVAGFEYPAANCARPFPKSCPFGIGNALRNGWTEAGSDCLAETDGKATIWVRGWRRRKPSNEKKKNMRLETIDPPSTPQNSFCRSFDFGNPLLSENHSVA